MSLVKGEYYTRTTFYFRVCLVVYHHCSHVKNLLIVFWNDLEGLGLLWSVLRLEAICTNDWWNHLFDCCLVPWKLGSWILLYFLVCIYFSYTCNIVVYYLFILYILFWLLYIIYIMLSYIFVEYDISMSQTGCQKMAETLSRLLYVSTVVCLSCIKHSFPILLQKRFSLF